VHGGWQAPLLDQASDSAMFEEARSMDALLLGRKTYEIFADYWPRAPEEVPFTGLLNRVPKYVASRTLTGPLTWQGSTIVPGDLAESITAVKERHDGVHVIGSLERGAWRRSSDGVRCADVGRGSAVLARVLERVKRPRARLRR
jgi:dihydrofolate reductase